MPAKYGAPPISDVGHAHRKLLIGWDRLLALTSQRCTGAPIYLFNINFVNFSIEKSSLKENSRDIPTINDDNGLSQISWVHYLVKTTDNPIVLHENDELVLVVSWLCKDFRSWSVYYYQLPKFVKFDDLWWESYWKSLLSQPTVLLSHLKFKSILFAGKSDHQKIGSRQACLPQSLTKNFHLFIFQKMCL